MDDPKFPTSYLTATARDAVAGETYSITRMPPGDGIMYHESEPPEQCEVLPDDGAAVILSDIPEQLQTEFGIEKTTSATFHRWNRNEQLHPTFEFEDGRREDVVHFIGAKVSLAPVDVGE